MLTMDAKGNKGKYITIRSIAANLQTARICRLLSGESGFHPSVAKSYGFLIFDMQWICQHIELTIYTSYSIFVSNYQ